MKVDIYYRPTCPWCQKALELLDDLKIEYTSYNITKYPKKREEMIERMGERSNLGLITVPQIFIDRDDSRGYIGIGGYDNLYDLYKKNKL